MDINDDVLYIEEGTGCEWRFGAPPLAPRSGASGGASPPSPPLLSHYLVVLPVFCSSMHRVGSDDNDHLLCTCARCGDFCDYGYVALDFGPGAWRVRIVCSHDVYAGMCAIPLVEVASVLMPIINEGCMTPGCAVCGLVGKRCVNQLCRGAAKLIYADATDALLAHFYHIGLDLCNPLLEDEAPIEYENVFIDPRLADSGACKSSAAEKSRGWAHTDR